MADDAEARPMLERYELAEVPRVSDPTRAVYRAFGLGEAGVAELFAPTVLRRGAEAWRAGHRPGWASGHVMQLPGLFLVYRREVADSFRHAAVSDRPDYLAFVRGG